MLVPTTSEGRMPRLSITSSTPMCERPLAPPPESTSATLLAVQLWARAAGATSAAARITSARRRRLCSCLLLVVVFGEPRGADRILPELAPHYVHRSRYRTIPLRLERR